MFTRVVVGVDGSPASRSALRWGAEQARRHDARLVAVMAWQYPLVGMVPMATGLLPPADAMDAASAEGLHQVVLDELGTSGDLDVDEHVGLSTPAELIMGQVEPGTLVVLGRGGRSLLDGLLHRSTGQSVRARHRCPVALVPA